jgi:hypothetical protein
MSAALGEHPEQSG